MFCPCIFFVVGVFVLYKLIDRLLRIPRIGNYGDRWVLVTGCDTGFGNIFAKRLDSLGCHVFAGCFTEKGETELRKVGSERLHVFHLDLTNRQSVQKALGFVKSKLPQGRGLWGLVNNAGTMTMAGPSDWFRFEYYTQQLEVNLLGLIDMTLTFLPLIKKEKGRLVNTASIGGRVRLPNLMPYCISKYGVEAFTDGLRLDLRHFGCKALIIEPGLHKKTALTSVDHFIQSFRRAFEAADPAVQKEYGEKYINYLASSEGLQGFMATGSDRTTDVADAYEHALFARYPRARYMVGWDTKYIYYPIMLLPEWLGDWLYDHFDPKRPLPASSIYNKT